MIGFSLLRAESLTKGIAFSTILNCIAKTFTFFTNVVIAFYFGTKIDTDVHYFAIGTISSVSYLIAGFSTAAVIPESMRIREVYGIRQSQVFLNFFILLFASICLLISSCFLFFAVPFFKTLSNYSVVILFNYRHILFLSILYLPINCLNTFLMEILTSYRYFTLPMIFSILTSLLSIGVIFIFHSSIGVGCIFTGLIIAGIINIVLLLYLMKTNCFWTISLSRTHLSRQVFKNIFYSEFGNLSTSLAGYIPLYIISGFSAGMNTALNYGKQIADLLNNFFSNQIAAVSGIKLNELYAKKETDQFNVVFISSAKIVIFLILPLSILSFMYSADIISVLFKRGKFDGESVIYSSMFLKYFSLSISFIGIDLITTRVILASQKLKFSFWYQIAINLFQIAAMFSLTPILKEKAIPVSLFFKYFVNFIVLWFFLSRILPDVKYVYVFKYFIKILTVNILTALSVFWITNVISTENKLLEIIYGGSIYFSLIILLSLTFNLNDDFNQMLLKLTNCIFRKRTIYEQH